MLATFLTFGEADITAIAGNAAALGNDLQILVMLAVGLPLGFYILRKVKGILLR